MKQGVSVLLLCLSGLLSSCAATGPTITTPNSPHASTAEHSDNSVAELMQQGDLAYQQGDLKAAEQAYTQVIKHSTDNAPAQYRLGNTLARQQRYDDAINAYKASLAQDAKQMQAYNNLATLYMYQAQAILASGVDHLPTEDGNTAQIKHMLWQLKKITPDKLQDVDLKTN